MTNQQFQALLSALSTLVKSEPKAAPKRKYPAVKPHIPYVAKSQESNVDGKTARQLKNDVNVAKAFKKAGFIVIPRVDALTYKGWLSKGMRVVPGQHGIFVKGVGTLFHSGQVATDVQPSKAEMTAEVNQMQSFPA